MIYWDNGRNFVYYKRVGAFRIIFVMIDVVKVEELDLGQSLQVSIRVLSGVFYFLAVGSMYPDLIGASLDTQKLRPRKKKVVSLGVSDYCPYVCVQEPVGRTVPVKNLGSENNELSGLMIAKVKEINRKLIKFKISLDRMPFARTLKESENGRLGGVVGLFRSKERESYLSFTDLPMLTSKSCFFTDMNSQWKYTGLKSLKGLVFAVVKGYAYEGSMGQHLERIKNTDRVIYLHGSDEPERITSFVALGRADVFNEDLYVARHNIQKLGLKGKIRNAGCQKEEASFYIALSKKAPFVKELVLELNRVLTSFRAD